MTRPPVLVLVLVAVLVSAPFFSATTFIGDDHLFLAFARLTPNPLAAFLRDHHGGEFYRPLPMLVWWLLGHAQPPAAWLFAALALGLHAAAAALVAALLTSLGRARPVAALAAALFLLAPQNLEAAYWYSASTDLFATVFTLASLVALLRGRAALSVVAALAAYLSKESALVLPALVFVVLGAAPAPPSFARRLRAVVLHVLLAALVLVVRRRVLGGWGGSGDPAAPLAAKLVQLASGLAHLGTGAETMPQPLAWGLGVAALALIVLGAARSSQPARWAPFAFAAAALAPLFGPGWIVGARYFYLPSVGLAWAAAEALAARPVPAQATICATLALLGLLQVAGRHAEIAVYQARLGAARRAVAEGARHGARVFHIDGGIKDLDLAVKEDPSLASISGELLVLGDVPASFVMLPPSLASRASFLLAAPPLPPSGAYQFGAARVVGLARRGDDPTLDDVIARFPDIRFIRLRPTPGGHVVGRDVTEQLKADSVNE